MVHVYYKNVTQSILGGLEQASVAKRKCLSVLIPGSIIKTMKYKGNEKEYHREYHKNWYRENRTRERSRQAKYKAEQAQLFREWKSTLSCVLCGYNSVPSALDFHHVDSSNKESEVSNLYGYSFARMVEEASKCVVLCKNCHCGVHDGLLTLPS